MQDNTNENNSSQPAAPTAPSAPTALTARQVLKKYRLTFAAIVFCVLSFAVAINLIPIMFAPIQRLYSEQGVNFPTWFFGLIIFISFGMQVIVLATCSKLPDKFGMRPVFIFTAAIAAFGFILLFLVPIIIPANFMIVGIIFAVVIYSIGAGFAVTIINPLINSMPFKNKERTLAIFHALFALLIFIAIVGTTLMVEFLPYSWWNFIPLFWVVVPVAALILWFFAPLTKKCDKAKVEPAVTVHATLSHAEAKAIANGENLATASVSPLKGKKAFFLIMMVAMTAAMASEAIVAKGSSLYIDVGLYVPKLVGDLLGPALFAIGLGLGRLLYGLFGKGKDIRNFMIFGSLAAFLLYLVAIFTPIPAIGVAALAVCGLAVSLLLPGLLAQTGTEFGSLGVKVFVWLSTASKIGAAGGPALFGLLGGLLGDALSGLAEPLNLTTEALGLRAALLICALFPLLSFILQIILKKKAGVKSSMPSSSVTN